jgi:hypothetical protein
MNLSLKWLNAACVTFFALPAYNNRYSRKRRVTYVLKMFVLQTFVLTIIADSLCKSRQDYENFYI